jgi:hypothetical protein
MLADRANLLRSGNNWNGIHMVDLMLACYGEALNQFNKVAVGQVSKLV